MTTSSTTGRRFGIMIYPDKPIDRIVEEAQWVESLGFDHVFLPDHTADLRNPQGFWLETMTTLAIIARETRHIRVGTLVSNPIMRSPFVLAKQFLTIDHASGGRLDIGIGAGLFDWDHAAMGTDMWESRERTERLEEIVAMVDATLRGTGDPVDFDGRWYRAHGVRTVPAAVQQPRPPIIIGGQSPAVLRIAARYADEWNTIGPMGKSAEEILATTARQNQALDQLAIEAGRDPASIRRSYSTFGPWVPWDQPDPVAAFEQTVRAFSDIGMQDFHTGIPDNDPEALAEVAHDLIPRLRERPVVPTIETATAP